MSKKINVKLSEQIRSIVESSGRTQASIAKELGITPVHLNYFLRGHKSVSVRVLDQMAEMFKISANISD